MRKADNLTTILCRCHEIWEPQPPGTLLATPGLLQDCFTFTVFMIDNLFRCNCHWFVIFIYIMYNFIAYAYVHYIYHIYIIYMYIYIYVYI